MIALRRLIAVVAIAGAVGVLIAGASAKPHHGSAGSRPFNYQETTAMAKSGKGYVVAGTAARCGPRAGSCSAHTAFITRVRASGEPTRRFGHHGTTTLTFSKLVSGVTVRGAAVDSEGRVLIEGGLSKQGYSRSFVARFTARGHLDRRFAGDGTVTMAAADFFSYGGAITTDDEDRVLVAGDREDTDEAAVLRLLESGAPDPGFGNGQGVASVSIPEAERASEYTSIRANASDSIVVGGFVVVGLGGYPAVSRLDSTGAPDTSFGGDGSVVLDVEPASAGGSANTLLDAEGGGITVVSALSAHTCSSTQITRLRTDGSPDPSFGESGYAYLRKPVCVAMASAARDRRGRIVLVGRAGLSDARVIAARFGDTGQVQAPYAGTGIVRDLKPSGHISGATSVVAASRGGGVVIGGFEYQRRCWELRNQPCQRAIVAKLKASGHFDRSFGGHRTGWRKVGP